MLIPPLSVVWFKGSGDFYLLFSLSLGVCHFKSHCSPSRQSLSVAVPGMTQEVCGNLGESFNDFSLHMQKKMFLLING